MVLLKRIHSSARLVPSAVAALLAVALTASAARALEPDELLLLANKDYPGSTELARFYAEARRVPDGRILALPMGRADLSFADYEMKVVPAVRAFLREHGLAERVRCVVTFYGTPLRIAGKITTDAERAELAAIRQELQAARDALPPIIDALEGLARETNPDFAPAPAAPDRGNALEQLGRRADVAMRTIGLALRQAPQQQQFPLLVRLGRIVLDFTGPVKLDEMFRNALPPGLDAPGSDPAWREAAARAKADVEVLQERRYDVAARAELRKIMRDWFGAFGRAHLLQAQADYLEHDGTQSAFDSELALLWWNFYPRSKWQVNPLHYRARGMRTQPVLMTMRIDAPTQALAREIVTESLQAEREGLKGRFVIDSRGIQVKPNDGYGIYDQSLRNLRNIVTDKTKMRVTFDDRPDVLAPRTSTDVALYCGWYSLHNYVPSSQFNSGAVAFHVASLELLSLHNEKETGWVAGLMRDNVAATLGAVAEPYLHAFPSADDFFPLLLTGELPLAEVYWRTAPLTSWMINMIGDPLYTPYKVNPQMKADDLPPRLKDALQPLPRFAPRSSTAPVTPPVTPPATAPATAPATEPGPVPASEPTARP